MRDSWSSGLSIVYLVGLLGCSLVAGRLSMLLKNKHVVNVAHLYNFGLVCHKAKSLLIEEVCKGTTGEAHSCPTSVFPEFLILV